MFLKGESGSPGEIQTGQSHFCARQEHGAESPGNMLKQGKERGDW